MWKQQAASLPILLIEEAEEFPLQYCILEGSGDFLSSWWAMILTDYFAEIQFYQ